MSKIVKPIALDESAQQTKDVLDQKLDGTNAALGNTNSALTNMNNQFSTNLSSANQLLDQINGNFAVMNQKMDSVIEKMGNVQAINGKTGTVSVTFSNITAAKISGTTDDYCITFTPGSVAGV